MTSSLPAIVHALLTFSRLALQLALAAGMAPIVLDHADSGVWASGTD